MATYTVTDDIIKGEAAEAYFLRADRRLMMGLRATLEILGIPCPLYAVRRKPGSTPAGAVLNAYHGDYPAPRHMTLRPRKPNAHASRLAEIAANQAARMAGAAVPSLYDETFPG